MWISRCWSEKKVAKKHIGVWGVSPELNIATGTASPTASVSLLGHKRPVQMGDDEAG